MCHDIAPNRGNIDEICRGTDRPVRIVNHWVGNVEVRVLDLDLRFKALEVARKSQENVFGVYNADMPGTEAVESI